jgi:hypothetical protein
MAEEWRSTWTKCGRCGHEEQRSYQVTAMRLALRHDFMPLSCLECKAAAVLPSPRPYRLSDADKAWLKASGIDPER